MSDSIASVRKKKVLIGFHHGIGDFINFTPCLRMLHSLYDEVHVCCKPDLVSSGFLKHCPYVSRLMPLLGHPWGAERQNILVQNTNVYLDLLNQENYDAQYYLPDNWKGQKAEVYVQFCCLPARGFDAGNEESWRFEVWHHVDAYAGLRSRAEALKPYVFIHNQTPLWPQKTFAAEAIPEVANFRGNVINTTDPALKHNDINESFVYLEHADRVVVADSVFMWAAIAMRKTLDYVHYAFPDARSFPLPFQRRLIRRCNIDFTNAE